MNVQQRLLKFDFVGDFLSMQDKKKEDMIISTTLCYTDELPRRETNLYKK